jgi:hypothetical protein
VKAAWIAKLQPGGEIRLPAPSVTWDVRPISRLEQQLADEAEADLTLKLLAAFQLCTRCGERLLAIDWQHGWFYFDPHGGVTSAARDEWAMPILPDIDSYHFVAPDFRFGVGGCCVRRRLWAFGEELLAALNLDPPRVFNQACPRLG